MCVRMPARHETAGLVRCEQCTSKMALTVQAMDQKIMGRDAVLAKLKAANDRPQSAQASEERQLSRMSRSIRASRKQVCISIDMLHTGHKLLSHPEKLAMTLNRQRQDTNLMPQQ